MRLDKAEDLSRILGSLYDAALDPSRWEAFLEVALPYMSANTANFLLADSRSPVTTVGACLPNDLSILDSYNGYYAERNILTRRAADRGLVHTGSIVTSEELVSRQELERSEYYQGYLKAIDCETVIGGVAHLTESRVALISFQRPRASGPVTTDDLASLRLLLPHLQRAQEIHRHLADTNLRREIQAAALDRLEVGVVLLGSDRDLLHVNRAADGIFASRDGLNLSRQGLRAQAPETSRLLDALISNALAAGTRRGSSAGGTLLVSRPSGRRPYQVVVSPLVLTQIQPGQPCAAAVVFVSDPDRRVPGVDVLLRRTYGLTPAEARLAALLLDGSSQDEASDQLRITRNTLKVHMKRIFAKTGTRRQGELIRLVLLGMAGLSR